MAKPRKHITSAHEVKSERQLIFKTPGAITGKYSVNIWANGKHHASHFSGIASPAEALWLGLGKYFNTPRSLTGITDILVVGYSQTKKEREQGVAHAYLHFPLLPTTK